MQSFGGHSIFGFTLRCACVQLEFNCGDDRFRQRDSSEFVLLSGMATVPDTHLLQHLTADSFANSTIGRALAKMNFSAPALAMA